MNFLKDKLYAWLPLFVSLLFMGAGFAQVTMQAPSGGSNYQWYEGTTAISGQTGAAYSTSTAGVYFATYTTADACDSATGYTIIVDECGAGESITLSAPTADSYAWYSGGSATGVTTQDLTVTATQTATTYYVERVEGACTIQSASFTVINLQDCGVEVCDDTIDNDGDGDIDCDDADCALDPSCLEDCTDGVDNDGDGDTDCADADCAADASCSEDCTDGVDNDLDGAIDCADTDCAADASCSEDCTCLLYTSPSPRDS